MEAIILFDNKTETNKAYPNQTTLNTKRVLLFPLDINIFFFIIPDKKNIKALIKNNALNRFNLSHDGPIKVVVKHDEKKNIKHNKAFLVLVNICPTPERPFRVASPSKNSFY